MALRLLVVLVLALAAAQVQRFDESNPPVVGDLHAPPLIDAALRSACYDCHSNETRWPWYSSIAPLSWFVHRDVSEGRRRLNFSVWSDYVIDPGTREQKLKNIWKRTSEGDMAPWYYRAVHPDSRWSDAQRDQVLRWVETELAASPANSAER